MTTDSWAPRHRGWKLAHHLLPAFVLVGVLLGFAVGAAWAQEWLLAAPLAALGFAAAWSIVREFRRGGRDVAPSNTAVVTSTGPRAATRFASSRASAPTGGLTVGVAVVTLISALALGAETLSTFAHPRDLVPGGAALMLLAVGVLLLVEGVRMLRQATDQPPGVYLTRSRVIIVGQRGTRELFWKDVRSIRTEDPPRTVLGGRRPLGDRGPSRIVVTHWPRLAEEPGHEVIEVQYLLCDPNALLATLRHYAGQPADRPELGTPEVIGRLRGGETP
ncbi:hypothetical protein [Zhihengliuella sp.]|uniref:hypothetical protein n=1 Tax=Zhihengliuella sp. TaxID=1954483 RepID=UPI0028125D2E|nr:hypothetical protein [Zhihengliuella sp.]